MVKNLLPSDRDRETLKQPDRAKKWGTKEMENTQQVKLTGLAPFIPAVSTESIDKVYERNRHRVYSLAFWMTDNELVAEEILGTVFQRAFAITDAPSDEMIDHVLIAELRQSTVIGPVTLNCAVVENVENVRRNTKRIHLERAIVQLPATERMLFCMHDGEGYSHERIARTLGVSVKDSKLGLHQARLRIRELVSRMN